MTLFLREVGRFLVEAGLWMTVMAVIAVAIALPVQFAWSRSFDRATTLAGIGGGAGIAALAHRIGVGVSWTPLIGGRPLPVLWAAVGTGATVSLILMARTRAE